MSKENGNMNDPFVAAKECFHHGAMQQLSKEDLSRYVQSLILISARVLNGIEGHDFKMDYLTGAIIDSESINPNLFGL